MFDSLHLTVRQTTNALLASNYRVHVQSSTSSMLLRYYRLLASLLLPPYRGPLGLPVRIRSDDEVNGYAKHLLPDLIP